MLSCLSHSVIKIGGHAVGFEPTLYNFFNLCKKLDCIMLITIQNKKVESVTCSLLLSYKSFKLKLRVFLAGHIVAMVTNCVTELTTTYSALIG